MRSTLFVLMTLAAVLVATPTPAVASPDPAGGHDFIAEARALAVVGACTAGDPPLSVPAAALATHCKAVRKAQDDYRTRWIAPARAFFAANVPATIPSKVVYPFAGGDLATALTVFPNADEITMLSLEPAGDPRALGRLGGKPLRGALATVETEMRSLYRSSFSVTMNMIGAMRGGKLPTQLIFSLSALSMHGYEPTAMRYFHVNPDGTLRYVTTSDLAANDRLSDAGRRNRAFANVELRFRKQGATREQVFRHIMANLDDAHLAAEAGPLRHLESKGQVAAMTKAASYLLSFDEFSTMRRFIIDHVAWMVSDTTGLPPKYGTPAGFTYETHGTFERSNMKAGGSVTPAWRAMFAAQPKRPLPFRFGYPDGKFRGHLIIMRKAR